MKKTLLVGLVCVLLLPIFIVNAAPAQNFNTVLLNVKDQSSVEFKKALTKGFNEILVRLTGNVDVLTFPAVQRVTRNAKQYVQYYRYLTNSDTNDSSTTSLNLQITFNGKALRTLLEQANIPVWTKNNRPKTLIWIKTTQNNQVNFLSSTADNQTADIVHTLSMQYGLPILLPAMDLQDIRLSQQSIHQNTIPSFDIFQALMQRYGTNAILFGDISQKKFSNQWQSHWRLSFMNKIYQWSSTGKTPSDLIKKAFQKTIDTEVNYPQNNNVHTIQKETILLHVFNIDDLQAYSKLSQYIGRFNKTKKISLDSLSPSTATFKITLMDNETTALIRYLNKDHRLHFIKQENTILQMGPEGVQDITPVLYYNYGETTTSQYQTQ